MISARIVKPRQSTPVLLMFGAEFVTHFRNGRPGEIILNGEVIATFDEVVCDSCNATISPADRCMLVNGSDLWCDREIKEYERHFADVRVISQWTGGI